LGEEANTYRLSEFFFTPMHLPATRMVASQMGVGSYRYSSGKAFLMALVASSAW